MPPQTRNRHNNKKHKKHKKLWKPFPQGKFAMWEGFSLEVIQSSELRRDVIAARNGGDDINPLDMADLSNERCQCRPQTRHGARCGIDGLLIEAMSLAGKRDIGTGRRVVSGGLRRQLIDTAGGDGDTAALGLLSQFERGRQMFEFTLGKTNQVVVLRGRSARLDHGDGLSAHGTAQGRRINAEHLIERREASSVSERAYDHGSAAEDR